MEKKVYQSPEVEVFEVAVEQGFAQSGPSGTPHFTPFDEEQEWG